MALALANSMGVQRQLFKQVSVGGDLSATKSLRSISRPGTELAKKVAQLKQALKAAEATTQAKSLFLANIIHELRTPMNAILGYAQLLQRATDIPKRHQNAIETIEKSGVHLLALINDVLDLSKLEAGRMELQPNDFELNALLYDLSAMFDVRSSQKRLDWRVEIWHPEESSAAQAPALGGQAQIQMPGWRLRVNGDERKLRQILINLLSNAINFTERGEVVLKVVLPYQQPTCPKSGPGLPSQRPSAEQYYFEVRDTGQGIAPDAQARIFRAFEQGPAAAEQGGTGLGLTIAQRLISLMGGTLHLDSHKGVGSRFFFTIPLKRAKRTELADQPQVGKDSGTESEPAYAAIKIPPALHDQLRATAELYSTTEFKACLRELEKLGESERLLAARCRALLQSYDMDSIVQMLSRVGVLVEPTSVTP